MLLEELLGARRTSWGVQQAIGEQPRGTPFLEQGGAREMPIELIQERQCQRRFPRAQCAFRSRQQRELVERRLRGRPSTSRERGSPR